MKFKSAYFDTVDDLVQAKDDASEGVQQKRERLDIIRRFVNMLNTMTPEEAERLGRTEITNHGLAHRDMLQNETQFTSMVTVTNALVEVLVDTDNPEQDLITGQRISEAVNRGALHYKGKFANFWRKAAGEIVIAGGCPATQKERYGWLPELQPDMIFPKGTGLDAENITYAFSPKELTMEDLQKLSQSVKDDKERFVSKKNIDALIEILKEQIKNGSKIESSSFKVAESVRGDKTDRNVTVSAWVYYEVKWDSKGEDQYVSSTLFMDGLSGNTEKIEGSKDSVGKVLAYVDKAYDQACDWLHLICVDSEIGGVKDMDTLQGLAEMIYPSSLEMEELLNLTIEGDKIRSRPKLRLTDKADPTAIAKWDIVADTYVPEGLEEMPFKNDSRGLQTPFALLGQNVSGMAASSVANGPEGGELRQQALERQQNSAAVQTNRVSEAYNHLESLLETVVYRLLAGPVRPGTPGYRETMWVRNYLKKYKIDYESLAKRSFGRFDFLRVRAKRTVGNGDRVQQLGTSDWLMKEIQNYPPAARPRVLHMATVLRTQDPDLADSLVKIPKSIINAQRITAENEFDTISRRAALGQTLPVAEDDVHQDHIPSHLIDMQAVVAQASVRMWDKLDVLAFAGMVEHVGEHIKILMGNPVTAQEGAVFIQDYQNITQSAQKIIAQVEEAEGSDHNQLTPKEQADLQIKWAGIELQGRSLGMKMEDMQRLWQNREARAALSSRQQYTREIGETQRLELDKAKLKAQSAAKKKTK